MSSFPNCKSCNKEIKPEEKKEGIWCYSIEMGDEVARKHNQSEKFKLCPGC